MNTGNDFAYALERLKRINALVAGDPALRAFFIDGPYDFLQMYQPLIFLALRTRAQGTSARRIPTATTTRALAALGILTVSCLAYLLLLVTRKRVLVFSGDRPTSHSGSDFRLAGIYAFLHHARIPYSEVFYTTLSRLFFTNLVRRGRPAMYLEAVDVLAHLFVHCSNRQVETHIRGLNLSSFGEDAEAVRGILTMFVQLVPLSLFRIRVLTSLLRPTGVRALLTIDNVRHYHELVAACNALHIHTYAFQHGQFGKYQVGWLRATHESGNIVKPEKLIVWSDYWRDELARHGTYFAPDELVVGGNASGAVYGLLPPRVRAVGEEVRVLIPFESDISREEVLAYMHALRAISAVRLYFKPRADRAIDAQLAAYELAECEVTVVTETRDALLATDLVLGSKSTFLYDAIAAGRPVVYIRTIMDHAKALAEQSLVEEACMPVDLARALHEAAHTSRDELVQRRARLIGREPILLEKTLRTLLCEADCT